MTTVKCPTCGQTARVCDATRGVWCSGDEKPHKTTAMVPQGQRRAA